MRGNAFSSSWIQYKSMVTHMVTRVVTRWKIFQNWSWREYWNFLALAYNANICFVNIENDFIMPLK